MNIQEKRNEIYDALITSILTVAKMEGATRERKFRAIQLLVDACNEEIARLGEGAEGVRV